LYLIATKH